jgi:hypothetical protein
MGSGSDDVSKTTHRNLEETAICLLALGLMERDGVVIGVGFVAAVLALVIVSLASTGAVNAVHHWFSG